MRVREEERGLHEMCRPAEKRGAYRIMVVEDDEKLARLLGEELATASATG